ncbi:hypothetical protein ACEQ8H_000601 [Pleosporales sp. CAS-2024a]
MKNVRRQQRIGVFEPPGASRGKGRSPPDTAGKQAQELVGVCTPPSTPEFIEGPTLQFTQQATVHQTRAHQTTTHQTTAHQTTAHDASLQIGSHQDFTPDHLGYQAMPFQEDVLNSMLHADYSYFPSAMLQQDSSPAMPLPAPNMEPDLQAVFNTLVGTFATPSAFRKWFPTVAVDQELIFSANMLAAAWKDGCNNLPGDSEHTRMLKLQLQALLNERINHPRIRYDDTTLKVMLALMFAEMYTVGGNKLKAYEDDVALAIRTRGGFRGNAVEGFAVAYCYHSYIIREGTPQMELDAWTPADLPRDSIPTPPASPLFCLDDTFANISGRVCRRATRSILQDIHHLTESFIATYGAPQASGMKEEEAEERQSNAYISHRSRSEPIIERINALPSAAVAGHTDSDDWVYESCRIAALIYTDALHELRPFSHLDSPGHANHGFSHAHQYPAAQPPFQPSTRSLPEELLEALVKTNLPNVWSDMIGVLYWVCTVGAIAARGQESCPFWVRRSLNMHAARAVLIQATDYPASTVMALKKLYTVQETIRKSNQL